MTDALVAEWEKFRTAAMHARADLDVPACPGWHVSDLVEHLGRVYHFFAEMIRSGRERPFPLSEIASPVPGSEVEWADAGLKSLVGEINSRSPEDFAWSWTTDKTVRWVARRILHETLVHRWDLEAATGEAVSTDPALASDCIDEVITSFVLGRKSDSALPSGSVHLHCNDTEGEWIIEVLDGSLVVRKEHAKGDAAVRGDAKSLALLMWRRLPLDAPELTLFGEPSPAREFVAYGRL